MKVIEITKEDLLKDDPPEEEVPVHPEPEPGQTAEATDAEEATGDWGRGGGPLDLGRPPGRMVLGWIGWFFWAEQDGVMMICHGFFWDENGRIMTSRRDVTGMMVIFWGNQPQFLQHSSFQLIESEGIITEPEWTITKRGG